MFGNENARIFRFMAERDAIIRDVTERVVDEISKKSRRGGDAGLEYVLNEAAFLEMKRLERGSSALDLRPYSYWQELARSVGRSEDPARTRVLRELVAAYAEDVAGRFTPSVYRFASKVLPVGLAAVFNATNPENLVGSWRHLSERIIVEGAVAHLRALAEIGTLVVVPTHSSNLDSIVVGWALEEAGLPPVTYGAGKNLFTNPLTSFFMHNLGAYKVDRRIGHGIYKAVLKCYSEVLLERGFHSLFFPGGTRSRSNQVESKIKLGLLGTALTAYRHNLLARKPKPKVFICPLTINYHLVLEAETLIGEHLRTDGGARYIIEDDEFADLGRIAKFVSKTMKMEHTLYLRFGEPLDPFGNPVDLAGISRDPHERPVDLERYLWRDGEVSADAARDAAYTKECGAAVTRAFARNTVVTSSAFVAAVVQAALQDAWPHLDTYRLLRVARGELVPTDAIMRRAERLQLGLREATRHRRLALSHDVERLPVDALVARGAKVLGMYHATPVLRRASNGLEVCSPQLLLFYANRLAGFGLEPLLREPGAAAGPALPKGGGE